MFIGIANSLYTNYCSWYRLLSILQRQITQITHTAFWPSSHLATSMFFRTHLTGHVHWVGLRYHGIMLAALLVFCHHQLELFSRDIILANLLVMGP